MSYDTEELESLRSLAHEVYSDVDHLLHRLTYSASNAAGYASSALRALEDVTTCLDSEILGVKRSD